MNYDPNIMFGVNTVKVTLQQWEYSGYVIMTIGGNCKGADIIKDASDLDEFSDNITENQCEFKVIDEPDDDDNYWFNCVLHNVDGEDMQVEDELDSLKNYIVKVEIIDFTEDKTDYDCADED